ATSVAAGSVVSPVSFALAPPSEPTTTPAPDVPAVAATQHPSAANTPPSTATQTRAAAVTPSVSEVSRLVGATLVASQTTPAPVVTAATLATIPVLATSSAVASPPSAPSELIGVPFLGVNGVPGSPETNEEIPPILTEVGSTPQPVPDAVEDTSPGQD